MPQSPGTPSRRRPSSGYSQRPRTTSQGSISSPHFRSSSRRSSNNSLQSPSTPRAELGDINELGVGSLAGNNGLGSLADELAEEEWDESRVEQKYPKHDPQKSQSLVEGKGPNPLLPPFSPSIDKSGKVNGYDGSEYGEDDLVEVKGITPTLEKRLAEVEALARQGTGDHDTKESGVMARLAEQLRDLSSQASMETQIARLSTANTALITNLTYQSRALTTLTQKLFSPLAAPPDPESCEQAAGLISTLITSLPQPTTPALDSLYNLRTLSTDLATTLSQLTDSLQMARQTTNDASRRLRSANEAVSRLRKELDEAEEGRRWLEDGSWEAKLKNREASKTCHEVVQGFEATCSRWRELIAHG